jgi:hypothetical protein
MIQTIEEFENGLRKLQEKLSEQEYDQTINEFWEYFHLCYVAQ